MRRCPPSDSRIHSHISSHKHKQHNDALPFIITSNIAKRNAEKHIGHEMGLLFPKPLFGTFNSLQYKIVFSDLLVEES